MSVAGNTGSHNYENLCRYSRKPHVEAIEKLSSCGLAGKVVILRHDGSAVILLCLREIRDYGEDSVEGHSCLENSIVQKCVPQTAAATGVTGPKLSTFKASLSGPAG